MPGPVKDDDSLIPVNTRFHSLALRPGGLSRDQAIQSAEAVLGELKPQFGNWLDHELQLLIASIPAGATEVSSDDPWLEPAYRHCRAVRDVGATMGFELLTFAANNLCDIIEVVRAGVECPFDAIESQIQALLLAKREVDRARQEKPGSKTPPKRP
jgi:hypothetical protein